MNMFPTFPKPLTKVATRMIGLSTHRVNVNLLRETVERQLCELGHLEPKQFPMTQREVVRAGKICGLYFCVHGPRSVKLTAIADLQNETVIFYGSDGVRRQSIPLETHVMPLPQAAA